MLSLLWAGTVLSNPPQTMSFQGTLADSDGQPVPDGQYQITFSIWDDSTGGLELWSEIQTADLVNGFFSVMLGEVDPLDPSIFEGGEIWLQMQVESDPPMTPRRKLNSVPFSRLAGRVRGDIATGDGFLRVHPPEPGTPVDSFPAVETNVTGDEASILFYPDPGPPNMELFSNPTGGGMVFYPSPGPPDIQMQLQNAGDSAFFEMTTQGERVMTARYGAGLSSIMLKNPLSPNNSLEMNVGDNGNSLVFYPEPGPPTMELKSDSNSTTMILYPDPGPPGISLVSGSSGNSMTFYPDPGPPDIQMDLSNNSDGANLAVSDAGQEVLNFGYDSNGSKMLFYPDPGPPNMELNSNPDGESHIYMRDTEGDLGLSMIVNDSGTSVAYPNPGPPQNSVEINSDNNGSAMVFYPSPGPPNLEINSFSDGSEMVLYPNPGPPGINISSNSVGSGMTFYPDPGPPQMELNSDPNGESQIFMRDTEGDLGLSMVVNDSGTSVAYPNPGPPNNSVEIKSDNSSSSMVFYPNPGPPTMELFINTSGSEMILYPEPGPPGLNLYSNTTGSGMTFYPSPGPPQLEMYANSTGTGMVLYPEPGPPQIYMSLKNDSNGASFDIVDGGGNPLASIAPGGFVFYPEPGPPDINFGGTADSSGARYATTGQFSGNIYDSEIGSSDSAAVMSLEASGPDGGGNIFMSSNQALSFFNLQGNSGTPILQLFSDGSGQGELGIFKEDPGHPPSPCVRFDYDGTTSGMLMTAPDVTNSYELQASFSTGGGTMSFYNDRGTETIRFEGDGNGLFYGNIGIGATAFSPSNILTVEQFSATDPIADSWTTYSSRRWKKDIMTIDNALSKVMALRGVSYNWKSNDKPDIGLIAEEVGEVFPEIVTYEENGVDAQSVDYARLVAVLIEGMKEQQKTIESLQSTLEENTKEIEKLKSAVQKQASRQDDAATMVSDKNWR